MTEMLFYNNFRNTLIFYGKGLLAPRPTPKLEDHVVCPRLLIPYIRSTWRPFLHPQTRGRAMPWWHGTHLIWDNRDTIERNAETLNDASKEVGLQINVEKTKYMLLSPRQNAGQNQDMRIANRSFENVSAQIFGDDSNKSKFDSRAN
jgi:hypothetical protein